MPGDPQCAHCVPFCTDVGMWGIGGATDLIVKVDPTIVPFSQVGCPNYNRCDEGQTVKYDLVVSNLQVGVIRYWSDTEVAQSLRSGIVPCQIVSEQNASKELDEL